MFGIIYIVLSVLLGKEMAGILVLRTGKQEMKNQFWLLFPAAFGVGTLFMTWGTYAVSWAASVCAGAKQPLLYGNLLVMGVTAAGLAALYWHRKKSGKNLSEDWRAVGDRRRFRKEAVFFGILLIVITWIMFFVFHIRDGILYSGFTVFGDYAPHTAMIRSFSWGNNFPTQYPHFGGEDVRYHFMFQFLTGNLEYLGLRLDVAYNLVSILSLLGFLMLLGQLAWRLAGSFAAEVLSVVFFFFRSGTAFFRFAWEHLQAGDLWKALSENTTFIGYTENETWGLWNFNVYLNQRHLAFGMILVSLSIWIYLDWLEAGNAHEEKGWKWLADRIFTKEAWKFRQPKTAALVGVILGLCAFWNGAAVIGGLLILLGFAAFSDGKLDYALTAAVAVLLSALQSKFFILGQTVSPQFYFGFLAEDASILGVLRYLFQISFVFFLGLAVLVFFLKRKERTILVSFLFPTVFAFCASLTADINVNHKYVMISYGFLTIFWAWAAISLWKKRLAGKLAAVILAVCLTTTGIYDFVVIIKDNDASHRMWVKNESELSRWLASHLEKDDLILTPEYSMNEVTLSGVMLYCGWPYYAWSAGYDTYYRARKAVEIYTTSNAQVLKDIVEQEGITYLLYEEDGQFEEQPCREDIMKTLYPLVYTSQDGRIRIYEAK